MAQWAQSRTSAELGIGSIPGWTTKDLPAARCSQKRQRDEKPNYYLDRGPKTGSHFRAFWDMKAFNHPDVTAKNQNWILYEAMCEWKRKMTRQPKQKKKEKTKDNTVVPRQNGKDQLKMWAEDILETGFNLSIGLSALICPRRSQYWLSPAGIAPQLMGILKITVSPFLYSEQD